MIERLRLHAFKLRRSNPGSVSHDLAARSIEDACAEIERLQYLYDKALTDIVKTSEALSEAKRHNAEITGG